MFLSSLTTILVTLEVSSWKVRIKCEHFWSLALRLNNEYPNYLKAIRGDNGTEFRNAYFD
jgi:hypothetical protein